LTEKKKPKLILFIGFEQKVIIYEISVRKPTFLLQAKADEMTRLMNENELLKSTIEDLKVGMHLVAFCSLIAH
jgi:hypothetical protein